LEHDFATANCQDYIDHQWLLAQFLGLAEALAGIQSVTEGFMTGYIQNINPRNVLVATAPVPELKLNVGGRTKLNLTNGNSSNKTNTMRDNAYPLPGFDGGAEELLRSYGIMSLGCLYTDLLVWFTWGQDGY
jgi:hypothetical protein